MRLRSVAFLIIFYFCYLLIGAAVFWAIEYRNEEDRCLQTIAELQQYEITADRGNVTIDNLRNLVELLLNANANGVQFDRFLRPRCAHNWNYHNAFFFAGTVVTTIGYGNISPSTNGGRIFCIFFAAFGLPMFGIMFGEIGEKFAGVFKKLEGKLKTKISREKFRKGAVLLLLVGSLLVFCLLFPSMIFMAVESWTYHEAFYYSFITLTTIGFGDFVVGTNPDKDYPSIYRVAVYFWILFGLAFMAAVISIFSELLKSRGAQTDQVKEKEDSSVESNSQNGNSIQLTDGAENKTPQQDENNGLIKRTNPKMYVTSGTDSQAPSSGEANVDVVANKNAK